MRIARDKDVLSASDVSMLFLLKKESPTTDMILRSIPVAANNQAYVIGSASFDLTQNEIDIAVQLQLQRH